MKSDMRQKIAFAMIMGVITTGIISFALISLNIGFVANFLVIWLKSWSMSYLIVIPAILLIGPKVQKLVDDIFKDTLTQEVD
ncbi:MAG: hypothetical protein BGO21_15890 [Dyadobacter sp. 50-39]|nr:MAG: hypothetical protein BGO21_15890 [Dyadobacter sp. 50-39]